MSWEEAPGAEPPDMQGPQSREEQEFLGLRGPRAQARALVRKLKKFSDQGMLLGDAEIAVLQGIIDKRTKKDTSRNHPSPDSAPVEHRQDDTHGALSQWWERRQAEGDLDNDEALHASVLRVMDAEGGIPSSAEPDWLHDSGRFDLDEAPPVAREVHAPRWEWSDYPDEEDFDLPDPPTHPEQARQEDPLELARRVEHELRQIWLEVRKAATYGFNIRAWELYGRQNELGLEDPFTFPVGTRLKQEMGHHAVEISGSLHCFRLGKRDGEEYYLMLPTADTSPWAVNKLFDCNTQGAARTQRIISVDSAAIIKRNSEGEYELVRRGSVR